MPGAALSVVSVVGVPIAFVGAGERIEDIEAFHADRFVSRLLGMGDVLTLIERAEEAIDTQEAEKLEEKIKKGGFSLEDFRDQLKTLRKMGPLEHILGMLPGMGNMKQLANQKPDEVKIATKPGPAPEPKLRAATGPPSPFGLRRGSLRSLRERRLVGPGGLEPPTRPL